jgi:O-antigen/teichoic acid export membrane protein
MTVEPAAAELRSRGARALAARAGWNMADQALTSFTNALLSILIARSVDANEFGAFAVCFTIYSLVIGLGRALISEPLAVRFSGAGDAFRPQQRMAVGSAAIYGSVVGVLLLVVAPFLGADLRDPLLALALTLPGLAVQDALRMSLIAEGRPRGAVVNDFVWGVLQVGGAAALLLTDIPSVTLFIAVWGVAAGVAAVDGLVRAQTKPALRKALRWLWTHRDFTMFTVPEYAAVMGAFQIAILVVGVIGGIAAVGALRGAQVLLGPLNIVMFGLIAFAIPEVARRKDDARRHLILYAVGISAAFFLATVVWTGFLLALPDSTGRELLGDAWDGGREVLPAMAVSTLAIALSLGAALLLKGLGAARETFRQNILLAPLLLGFGIVGVKWDGARGAAIGFAVAQCLPVPFWWWRLARTTRRLERQA